MVSQQLDDKVGSAHARQAAVNAITAAKLRESRASGIDGPSSHANSPPNGDSAAGASGGGGAAAAAASSSRKSGSVHGSVQALLALVSIHTTSLATNGPCPATRLADVQWQCQLHQAGSRRGAGTAQLLLRPCASCSLLIPRPVWQVGSRMGTRRTSVGSDDDPPSSPRSAARRTSHAMMAQLKKVLEIHPYTQTTGMHTCHKALWRGPPTSAVVGGASCSAMWSRPGMA